MIAAGPKKRRGVGWKNEEWMSLRERGGRKKWRGRLEKGKEGRSNASEAVCLAWSLRQYHTKVLFHPRRFILETSTWSPTVLPHLRILTIDLEQSINHFHPINQSIISIQPRSSWNHTPQNSYDWFLWWILMIDLGQSINQSLPSNQSINQSFPSN